MISHQEIYNLKIRNRSYSKESFLGKHYFDCAIVGSKFVGCDFRGVRISNSLISSVVFINCCLDEAVFDLTMLSKVYFSGCSFRGASFVDSKSFISVNFSRDCDLKYALGVKITGTVGGLLCVVNSKYHVVCPSDIESLPAGGPSKPIEIEKPLAPAEQVPLDYYVSPVLPVEEDDPDDHEYGFYGEWGGHYPHYNRGIVTPTQKYGQTAVLLCSNVDEYELAGTESEQ